MFKLLFIISDVSIYMTYINKFCNFSCIVLKKFKFYFYVLKIKSYLIGVKKLWYKNNRIYLKKLYGKYLHIFVTIFKKNKYNILVTYTYCFFSIPAFLCLILETYFLRDAKLYCPYTWCRVILEYPLFFWRGGTVSISRQPAIPGYQNITFDGTILTLCSAKITCNCTFVTVGSSLIFFLTFDGTILTLCSTNITCNYTFVTFNDSPFFFFFSHLMVPSLHYAVPTSHVTVLLSHSMVPLFFLTFDGTILTLL